MIKAIFKIGLGAFCLFLASKLGPYTYELYQKGKSSEAWVEVEAGVETFDFRGSRKSKSGTYSSRGASSNPHVDVVYRYHFDGIEYVGDRTGFGPYSKGQLVRPRRGKANIYVNPDNPAESVYIKGVSKPNLGAMAFAFAMGLFGVLLVGVGLKNIVKD